MELSIKWIFTPWLLLMTLSSTGATDNAKTSLSKTETKSSSANFSSNHSSEFNLPRSALEESNSIDLALSKHSLTDSNVNSASSLNEEAANIDNPSDQRLRRAAVQVAPRLIDEKQCPEVRSLCGNQGNDDLSVLECVQTFLSNQIENLADECQHAIWTHTATMMSDRSVLQTAQKPCQAIITKLDLKPSEDTGIVLAKLIDHKDEIKQSQCVTLVNRLEAVAFSDFRFVSAFVRDCSADIEVNACGRFHLDRNVLSQGETLACLQTHIDSLTEQCKKGIIHLSELQAENVKLDRPLFAACGEDVVRLCGDVRPGQIYKCLLLHKNDALMSHSCQEQLLRRYKIIAHDYKVSKGLARSCKEDIKLNHCRRGVSEDKDVRLAQILLCLEAAHKNNTKISPECLAEIFDHRKLLMEDYQMSPEILSDCADDITKFCNDLEAGGGKTIHCLMENARPKKKKDRRVTARCQRAIEMLMKVTDIGEDWRVDPILRKACRSVVDMACSNTEGGDARVMSCLRDKIGTKYMKPDCEIALKQINYFVARNFKLDPQLYRNCKDEAVKICHAKTSWSDVGGDQMDPDREPLILPCLYRYAYDPSGKTQLGPSCLQVKTRNSLSLFFGDFILSFLLRIFLQALKFTMRRRAISVDLIPEVEDACLDDLANLCSEKTGKGEEMQCLQDNLGRLQSECKVNRKRKSFEKNAHL